MRFTQSLDVAASPAVLWPVLLDLEQVVPCLSGARVVERLGERSYRAAIKLRLGPMTLSYDGDIHLEQVDEAAGRAVLRGEANEARGQGTARATIALQLSEVDDGTRIDMDVDLALGGRVAQMGGRVVEDVSSRLIEQFAECLSSKVSSYESGGVDGSDVPGAAAGTPTAAAQSAPVEAARIRPARLLASIVGARLRRLLRRGRSTAVAWAKRRRPAGR